MTSTDFHCPAKLNLLLAVTGRRADGFHELVSLVTPVELGDTLTVSPADDFSLVCDDPAVPADGTNLVWKAALAFRAATRWTGGARFVLTKRIPVGAGLGGGSSDAAAALMALNGLAGGLLAPAALAQIAAEVGSDCPLFLAGGPVVMRGRGEQLEPLQKDAARRLRGRRVLIFKPAFGVSTPWAYARLAARSRGGYRAGTDAETRLETYFYSVAGGAAGDDQLFNDLERDVFAKFIGLPVLLKQLNRQFRLEPRMSGSGSACFAFLPEGAPVAAITGAIQAAWGATAFVRETRLT